MTGRFITLEGGEGVGKSTQAKRLAERLRAKGLNVVETREPGGSVGAEAIRELLLTGSIDKWSPRAEALLFAAARADHIEKTIRPALAEGKWVICDRFLDSTLAYQGEASGLSRNDLLDLHRIGSANFMPDRTLVLVLPIEQAIERARLRDRGRDDRFGARGADYHIAVASAFARLADHWPQRIRTVDASGSMDEVTGRLLAALDDLA